MAQESAAKRGKWEDIQSTLILSPYCTQSKLKENLALAIAIFGDLETQTLDLQRNVIYPGLNLPGGIPVRCWMGVRVRVLVCHLMVFTRSGTHLPYPNGAIFWSRRIRLANWREAHTMDWTMVTFVTSCTGEKKKFCRLTPCIYREEMPRRSTNITMQNIKTTFSNQRLSCACLQCMRFPLHLAITKKKNISNSLRLVIQGFKNKRYQVIKSFLLW